MDLLTPAAFAPVVKAFASARPLAVRHLAARALAPLISPEELCPTLMELLDGVPCQAPIANHNEVCCHSIFHQSNDSCLTNNQSCALCSQCTMSHIGAVCNRDGEESVGLPSPGACCAQVVCCSGI